MVPDFLLEFYRSSLQFQRMSSSYDNLYKCPWHVYGLQERHSKSSRLRVVRLPNQPIDQLLARRETMGVGGLSYFISTLGRSQPQPRLT